MTPDDRLFTEEIRDSGLAQQMRAVLGFMPRSITWQDLLRVVDRSLPSAEIRFRFRRFRVNRSIRSALPVRSGHVSIEIKRDGSDLRASRAIGVRSRRTTMRTSASPGGTNAERGA